MLSSSSTNNNKRKGNPLTTAATAVWRKKNESEQREVARTESDHGARSPSESFLVGSILSVDAREYLRAYYNRGQRREVWYKLCQQLNVVPPKHMLQATPKSPEAHFNNLVALVLEESLCAISTALAARWIDKATPQVTMTTSTQSSQVKFYPFPQQPQHVQQFHNNAASPSRKSNKNHKHCSSMHMTLAKRSLNNRSMVVHMDFQLPDRSHGFTQDQLFHIRPGTIVECMPVDNVGLTKIVLGAIVNTNRYAAAHNRSFTVVTTPENQHEHVDATQWTVQPLTSLVSELRQVETCLKIAKGRLGAAQLPFLPQLGAGPDTIELLVEGPTSPTSVLCLDGCTTAPQRGWKLPTLNDIQDKAAADFLGSNTGTLRLVQGPPGTGKTTFLVSTICQYMLKSLEEEAHLSQQDTNNNNNQQSPPPKREALMICAPSNKAIYVLASRFLAAIAEDTGRDRELRVVLVGDEDKLLEETLSTNSGGGTDAMSLSQQVTNNYHFVYKFLPNLQTCLQGLERCLKSSRSAEDGMLVPHSQVVFRLLAQFMDVAHLFKAGVKTRADSLCSALLRLTTKKRSEKVHAKSLEHLAAVLSDLRPLAGDKSLTHKVTCALIQRADVIFCTLASSGSSVFKTHTRQGLKVRDLIVDEAAAATEAELAIPFYLRPNRVLVVGDPMQLPATVLSPMAKKFRLDRSLHQRLMQCNYPFTMLQEQYRMRREISKFASNQFYEGKLRNSEKVEKSFYVSPCPLLEPSQDPFLFQDVHGREEQKGNGSIQNLAEAKAVVEWIGKLKAKAKRTDPHWFRSDKVRIITFYQAQVDLINSLLRSLGFGYAKSGLVATTVDSSQGCEADLVIVSFVRTCYRTDGSARSIAGFLTQDQRINVALTRARYELICVGSAANMLKNPVVTTLQALATEAESRGCIQKYTASTVDPAGWSGERSSKEKKKRKNKRRKPKNEESKSKRQKM